MGVSKKGQRHPRTSRHSRRRNVDPNGARSIAAKTRNPNPCARCQGSRQKCTGGSPCLRCRSKDIPCVPGKQDGKGSLSINTEPVFIFEDGKSPSNRCRPRSNTLQTIDTVVSPTSEISHDCNNVISPTSPLFQFRGPLVSPSVQSPTADLRFAFGSMTFGESMPAKEAHASDTGTGMSNVMQQGQATGSESSNCSRESTAYNGASSTATQAFVVPEVVTATSGSVSITGKTPDMSAFSYTQESSGSVRGEASFRGMQGGLNEPLPLDTDTFDIDFSLPPGGTLYGDADPTSGGFSSQGLATDQPRDFQTETLWQQLLSLLAGQPVGIGLE